MPFMNLDRWLLTPLNGFAAREDSGSQYVKAGFLIMQLIFRFTAHPSLQSAHLSKRKNLFVQRSN